MRSSATTNDAFAERLAGVDPAHPHDGDRRLRRLRRRHPFEDADGELEGLADVADPRVAALRHELRLDVPTRRRRLGHQRRAFDHEAALLVTRTAAPDQAPQFSNR